MQVPIRIVMAEDNLLVREGLRRILEASPDLRLVASCSGLDELLAEAAHQPDVVLTDIRMPPPFLDEDIRAAALLRRLGVLVLSQYDEPDYALRLLEHGSERRGYLLKDRLGEPAELISALRLNSREVRPRPAGATRTARLPPELRARTVTSARTWTFGHRTDLR